MPSLLLEGDAVPMLCDPTKYPPLEGELVIAVECCEGDLVERFLVVLLFRFSDEWA